MLPMRRALVLMAGVTLLIAAQFAVAVGLVFLIERPNPPLGWGSMAVWLILTVAGAKLIGRGWRR